MIDSIEEATIEEWNAIGSVYRLASRLLISEVDIHFLRQLSQSPLKESFIEMGGNLPDSIDSAIVDDLAYDYCRLFIGPSDHLPPYQSVWEYGQFQSKTIESMQAYAEIARFTPSELADNMMLDHLGIQLELMGHIIDQVACANSQSEKNATVELAAAFSRDHLQWAESLLSAASEKAELAFYRSSMSLICQFLESESGYWNELK